MAGGPVPIQARARPHLPAGAVVGPPPPHRVSSALEGDLGRGLEGQVQLKAEP